MYLLVIFKDLERTEIIFIGRFLKIKDIIEYTDGLVHYNCKNKDEPNSGRKYKTIKNLFLVIPLKS